MGERRKRAANMSSLIDIERKIQMSLDLSRKSGLNDRDLNEIPCSSCFNFSLIGNTTTTSRWQDML